MAEKAMNLNTKQETDTVQETAQEKLEAAYSRIMNKISGGKFEGRNETLIDDSGVRCIFGSKGADLVSVKLAAVSDCASERYEKIFGDSWDGVSPMLIVESGYMDGNTAIVPAQELFDFVHDKLRDEKLSITADNGEKTAQHEVNQIDGISDMYRTTVETKDGKTVEICTELAYTLQGFEWETMAFTNNENGIRKSLEDICCDLCDRSEDPTAMHKAAVKQMKEYSGDL